MVHISSRNVKKTLTGAAHEHHIFHRNCYSTHYYNQPKSFYVTSLRLALFRERIRIPQDSQGIVDI